MPTLTHATAPTVHCVETSTVIAHGTPAQLQVVADAVDLVAPIHTATPAEPCFAHQDCHVLQLTVIGPLDPTRYDATWRALIASSN